MKNMIFALLILSSFTFARNAGWSLSGGFLNYGAITIEAEGYVKISSTAYFTPGGGYGISFLRYSYLEHYIPHHATFNFGFTQRANFLELGYKGAFIMNGSGSSTDGLYSANFLMGYRHHGRKSKLVFKAFVAPGMQFNNGGRSSGWLWGINLGGRIY